MKLKQVRMANGTMCFSTGAPRAQKESAAGYWCSALKLAALAGVLLLLQQTLPL